MHTADNASQHTVYAATSRSRYPTSTESGVTRENSGTTSLEFSTGYEL
eukprot:IDg89t1